MSKTLRYIYKLLSIIRNRIPFVDQWKYDWEFNQQLKLLNLDQRKTRNGYYLTSNDQEIFIRGNSSDEDVFRQVFIVKEYNSVIQLLIINKIKVEYIIDAGANIGLASIVFSKAFPDAEIICVEPDSGNFNSLKLNTNNLKVKLLKKAVWNCVTQLEIDKNFRDGQDWSIQVKELSKTKTSTKNIIETVTITGILVDKKWNSIDLLKIDIEGAERFIFDDQYDISFLCLTKCIAIEIHDEFDIRGKIQELLINKGFLLFENGELTIGLNQRLIASSPQFNN
jgi:FkbM family methyltransferase